jgi:hypothetical protein
MCERGDYYKKITQKTAVSKASIYKIRAKAILHGWTPNMVLKPCYIDNTPRNKRPKVSHFITSLII